jgi:hypothetical protein
VEIAATVGIIYPVAHHLFPKEWVPGMFLFVHKGNDSQNTHFLLSSTFEQVTKESFDCFTLQFYSKLFL